jgi:hypothetical protein
LKLTIGTAIGGYISIVLAAFICGIELSISGAVPFEIAIPAMVYWHLLIGIGEAIISALIIFYICRVKPDLVMTESIMMNKVIEINISKYKRPITSILAVSMTLIVMIAVGFTIGILSGAPDGLERVLIDQNGESWLDNLTSPWVPILNWITSDYGAAILGIAISILVMISIFYIIIRHKKKVILHTLNPLDSMKNTKEL